MTQSKLESLIESVVSVIVGAVVGLTSQLIIFYFYDISVPFSDDLGIMFWFTAVSMLRSYIIRRWFNERLRKSMKFIIKEAK